MSRRLNPRMETALRLMIRGPLEKTPQGWIATAGAIDYDGEPFNSHTIRHLASQGYVRIIGDSMAHIRAAGRCALKIEEYAA